MSISQIRARIKACEEMHGRASGSVQLIAVSKRQPLERVVAALEDQQRVFGENYVQEAQTRWTPLTQKYQDLAIHMIGPLQTNKVKMAMGLFAAIHSLDRPSLAEKIARHAQQAGACPELFIQVNTGREPQKAGILPENLDGFIKTCRSMDLPLSGLMCIPPESEDSALHFKALSDMAARNGVSGLSMGMSEDFESAIAHGATHIRVGRAFFGPRSS